MAEQPLERHFTVSEVARALCVSEMTVRRWINADCLPAIKVGPKSYRIPESGYESFVAARAVVPVQAAVPATA